MRRARIVSHPRQIAMFLAREMTGLSFPRIGQHFACDHTTIIHAVRRLTRLDARTIRRLRRGSRRLSRAAGS